MSHLLAGFEDYLFTLQEIQYLGMKFGKKVGSNFQLFFLFLTISINMIGFSMVFPMLPYYAQTFQATPLLIGLLAASHAFASFLTAPILGRISDKYGRRPILVVGLAASVFSFLLMGAANSLWILLIGRVAHGVVASAILPTARAYMADITSGSQRVAAMGKLGAAMAFGFLIGPAFSSFLIGLGDIQTPFFVAAVISLLNVISVILFLPESVKEKASHIIIKEGFLNIFKIFRHLKGEHGILFLILFAWSFSQSNNQVAFPLLEAEKFNLGAEHIGYFFTALAVVSIAVQGFLLPKITAVYGEKRTLLVGMIIMGISLLLMPFAPTIPLMTIIFMMMGLGGNLNRPVAEGIISRDTETGQGTTMGLAQSFESLGRIIGPALAGVLYGTSTSAPFILSSLMLLFLAVISVRTLKIKSI